MAKKMKTMAQTKNLKHRTLLHAIVLSLREEVFFWRRAAQDLEADLQQTRAALVVEMDKVDNWVRQQDQAKTPKGRMATRMLTRYYGHNKNKVDWNEQQLHKLRFGS